MATEETTAHIRLFVPEKVHKRIKQQARVISVKDKNDITIANVYLKSIEIGLDHLEKLNS